MDPIGHYVSRFQALEGSLARAPGFLAQARRGAIERFAKAGFPGPKDEEWRATSVAPVAAVAFEPGARVSVSGADFERLVPRALRELGGPRLVFVNGLLDSRLSTLDHLPEGLAISSLGALIAREPGRAEALLDLGDGGRAFQALNTAFFQDGALVEVRDGASIDAPIHLISLSISDGVASAAMPRNVVRLGANARATLVETFAGAGGAPTLTDASTRIVLGEGASLDHYRLEREAEQAFHAGFTSVEQGRDSRYRSFSLADGAALARNELEVLLAGEGASCSLDGLTLAGGKQLIDHHTFVDHAAPRCTSAQLYKGILDGGSRAVFQGKVLVRPGAQKTDARQSNRNLLLTDEAQANSKPQLEIHADDVKCTHGSALGQLDREALFYLRARGIGEGEAVAMLTEAFAGEVLERLPLAAVRELAQAELHERILGRAGGKGTP